MAKANETKSEVVALRKALLEEAKARLVSETARLEAEVAMREGELAEAKKGNFLTTPGH